MAPEPSEPGAPPARKRDTREIVRLSVFGLGLILLIAFIVGNSSSVEVNFVFFSHKASLIWVILIAALLGVLIDRLVIVLGRRRKAKK
jgi:uncharacterized integral membrane protein